jgi:3-deoxy-7-phosphoheptulonate synthase
MILRLEPGTSDALVRDLVADIEREGLRTALSPEPTRTILAIVDPVPKVLDNVLRARPEVSEVVEPRGDWRQADRAFRDAPTVVHIGTVALGGGNVAVIAGPCSVEGEEAIEEAAEIARAAGAQLLRGGAFKPRTNPYAFQGLGREGLRQLKRAGEARGMPVVSEIMDAAQVDAFVGEGVDCLQIGARNMQNFTLLKAVTRAQRPVLLKRGLSATAREWLQAAEYLLAHGANDVVLCERGIRTFETATRNTLDLTVLPLLREWTHLPIVVDPSHAAGIPAVIPPLARAAMAAGADGIAVEAHPRPREALSDGAQALLPGELALLIAEVRVIAAVCGGRFQG